MAKKVTSGRSSPPPDEVEAAIKQDTSATIRVILTEAPAEDGACIRDGKPSKKRVHFALAY